MSTGEISGYISYIKRVQSHYELEREKYYFYVDINTG